MIMGHGVFYDTEGLTFICDPYDGLDYESDDYEFECQMAWGDFISNLKYSLPKGWETEFSVVDHCRAGTEIAYNGLYSLFVKECGSGNGNVYVTIRARESVKQDYFNGDNNVINLAVANMHKAMNRVAKAVAPCIGPLRRRTSGYTSSEFWPFTGVEFSVACL